MELRDQRARCELVGVGADVDVVIAVRNGGRLLREAVDSVLAQEGVRVRVLLVDDGSTDDAIRRLPADARLRVIPSEGRGLPSALNTGIRRGSAPYIARQDADDISLPGRLAAETTHLEAHPGIGLVATGFEVQVGRRVVGSLRPTLSGMLDKNPICHGTVMLRRSVVETVGGYRTQFRSSEDYDCWLRCADVAGLTMLPIVGYRYRVWGGQMTVTDPFTMSVWADLARRSALARRNGQADPAEDVDIGEPDRSGADEVQAWWAREFAALGSWPDALRCLRRLPPGRAVREAIGALGARPQSTWS